MKKILYLLLFLIPTFLVGQTTYYVSNNTGDNADDGLTEGNAWATLIYAESQATTAGDSILLERGNVWSTLLSLGIHNGGTVGNPIVWNGDSWGSGADAIIQSSGDRSSPNSAIVHISGCDYVTMEDITIDGGNTITYGLYIGGNSNTFSPSSSQNAEDNIIIQDCSIINIGDGSAYVIALTVSSWNNDISDITIRRNSLDGADDHAISFYPGRTNIGAPSVTGISDSYIGYNTVTNSGRRNSGTNDYIFINCKNTDIIVEHNTITQGVDGYGGGIVVGNNEPQAGADPTGIIIRYNNVTMDNGGVPMWIQDGGAIGVKTYSNLFKSTNADASYGGIAILYTGAADEWIGSVLEFYYNTVICDDGSCFLDNTQTNNVVTVRNNIFFSTDTDAGLAGACLRHSGTRTFTHSNNIYHRITGDQNKINDNYVYYDTEGEVQGWEATSEVTDPTFVTDFTDLHLQAGSPAIGAGTNVGVTLDYDGETYSTPPAIGAYEYIVGGVTAPAVTSSVASADWTRKGDAGGNVTSDGGGTVTARGVCWNTGGTPTTSDSKTTDGTGTGVYTSILRPLVANTTYYVRAYATNATGTSYGSEYSFTTPEYSILMNGISVQVSGGKVVIIK